METKGKGSGKVPEWLRQARSKWTYFGQERPPFAEEPEPGQRSVWDFPRPPALVEFPKKVEVKWKDALLASSTKALELQETASPPTVYLPPEDVLLEHFVKVPQRQSLCEWKGSAEYWALADEPDKPVAWVYPRPFSEYARLQGYFAFYPQYVDCFVDGERVRPQPGSFYAGWITDDLVGPFKGEPGSGHW